MNVEASTLRKVGRTTKKTATFSDLQFHIQNNLLLNNALAKDAIGSAKIFLKSAM